MIINKETLKKMNFSDFQVLNSQIDKEKKTIDFSLSGAAINHDNNRLDLGEGHLVLHDYDSIFITSYNAEDKTEKELSEVDYEELQEICEIDVLSDEVIIKGYAKLTFNWIEFRIQGGVVQGDFLDHK